MIEFETIENVNSIAFEIEEESFLEFSDVNDELAKQTGTFIDPYGTSKVSFSHCKLFVQLLAEFRHTNEHAIKLQEFLSEAVRRKATVLVQGE